MKATLLPLIFSAIFCLSVNAQPGSLDLTFGTGGKVTTDFASSSEVGNAVAIQSDGKIVVAGFSGSSFGLARYNSDGTLDITFGIGGKQTTAFGNNADAGTAIALQSDGKIVVAGTGSTGFYSYFDLARYQSNGTPDNTFGSNGRSGAAFNGLQSRDVANSVVIQSDGKIVVAGQSGAFGPSGISLARFFSNGSLDNTFGTGGLSGASFGTGDNYGKSVVIQSDGKIVVGGYAYNGSSNDFVLIRFLGNGTIDSTFDLDGMQTTDFAGGEDHGNSIAIQSDGKIVAVGQSWTGLNIDYALARYNSDGSLDATFGSGGKVTTPIGAADDIATSVAIQSDGKIVVAGISQGLADNDFSLVRYNSDGTPDITFDSDGKVTTPFGTANDNGNSVAIQSDGKIVVAGSSHNGSNIDFAVARYSKLFTGISESNMETDFTIYPNPFTSETTFKSNDNFINATLTIYNSLEQIVKQMDNLSGQSIILHRDNLSAGLYFLRLTQDNKIIALDKFVITD